MVLKKLSLQGQDAAGYKKKERCSSPPKKVKLAVYIWGKRICLIFIFLFFYQGAISFFVGRGGCLFISLFNPRLWNWRRVAEILATVKVVLLFFSKLRRWKNTASFYSYEYLFFSCPENLATFYLIDLVSWLEAIEAVLVGIGWSVSS